MYLSGHVPGMTQQVNRTHGLAHTRPVGETTCLLLLLDVRAAVLTSEAAPISRSAVTT